MGGGNELLKNEFTKKTVLRGSVDTSLLVETRGFYVTYLEMTSWICDFT